MHNNSQSKVTLISATLALLIGGVALSGCSSELDTKAYFPKTYETDFGLIANCEKSGSHGGKYVKTYITKSAEDAWKNKKYPFAEATVLAKVAYNDSACTDIAAYFAMKKVAAGKGGDAGDWSWQTLDADGQETDEGQLAGCTGCHKRYKANDYVGTLP